MRLLGIITQKNHRILLGVIIIISTVAAVLLFSYYLNIAQATFKPREIYPTKQGGREWHFDMSDPFEYQIFDPGANITKLQDGSWLVGEERNGYYHVRMNVFTPPGQEEWKNVEITGYVKVIDTVYDNRGEHDDGEDKNNDPSATAAISWYARGGRHSSNVPCEGTSLKGILHINGISSWQKEIWHTGGYTKTRAATEAIDSILNKWIGWKVIMYNINDDTAVRMESYIDENANNHWRKVSELVDNGMWYADTPDSVFYSANCNRPKDYVITNSGPIVTFRSDNILWQFKELSVREIDAP